MGTIRKSGRTQGHGGARQLDPAARQERQAARLKRIMSNGSARALIADAEQRAKLGGGRIGGQDLDDLMSRAMGEKPGSTTASAMREAIDHVVETQNFAEDAKPQAAALKTMAECRESGTMTKQQTVDMVQDMVDRSGGKLTDKASNAMKYAAWSNGDIMDDGAKAMMTDFLSAWYQDRVESGAVAEGRRQVAEQLAQDKRDFQDFMVTDKKEHKRLTYDEFKQDLQEHRVESSDWQTLMLWLQTGQKTNPIGN